MMKVSEMLEVAGESIGAKAEIARAELASKG
jgi:hypothetical protein